MMDDAREPSSSLKGRLADVYVPALVSGALEALSRRLGDRATVDDPIHGRASSLSALDPLIGKISSSWSSRNATYRHVASTTGVDRDASEGILSLTIDGEARNVPIAVVAERRRLREIELRVYYAPHAPHAPHAPPNLSALSPRSSHVISSADGPLPTLIATQLEALRTGDVDRAIAGFESNGHATDMRGRAHAKNEGALRSFLADFGAIELVQGGSADDGRTCCVEVALARKGQELSPALLSFERGDAGLIRELRVYWE